LSSAWKYIWLAFQDRLSWSRSTLASWRNARRPEENRWRHLTTLNPGAGDSLGMAGERPAWPRGWSSSRAAATARAAVAVRRARRRTGGGPDATPPPITARAARETHGHRLYEPEPPVAHPQPVVLRAGAQQHLRHRKAHQLRTRYLTTIWNHSSGGRPFCRPSRHVPRPFHMPGHRVDPCSRCTPSAAGVENRGGRYG